MWQEWEDVDLMLPLIRVGLLFLVETNCVLGSCARLVVEQWAFSKGIQQRET